MRNMSHHDFAKALGVAQQVVSRWLLGRVPATLFVQRIHVLTKGEVTLFDWPEHPPPKEPSKEVDTDR